MMNRDLVRKTEEFLKRKFDESTYFTDHPEDKAYRLEHTYRVANLGLQIARREGLDETGLVIACLLHDLSHCESFGADGWREHGRRSARLARPFLRELGLPEDLIREICYGIAIHVDDEADFPGERTPFALSVGDADNIDRFDVYRIHSGLCSDRFLEKSFAEKLEYALQRLGRLRELRSLPMATESAEEIWKARVDFYIAFYERLVSQLRSSSGVRMEP